MNLVFETISVGNVFLSFSYSILPIKVSFTLSDYFGFNKSMDEFKGRQGKKED